MVKYNFDKIIDRRGTASYKYDLYRDFGREGDELSLWVADMDFDLPDVVKDELHKCVDYGIFGYTAPDEKYFKAVCDWQKSQFDRDITPDNIVISSGIVFGISAAICAFSEVGDSNIIQRPVYYPFTNMILENKRKLINSPLYSNGNRYVMDYEDFERKVVEEKVKMFIFCSPHNPVGRVWDADEIKRIADICVKHNVLMVCDEIHNDWTLTKPQLCIEKVCPAIKDNLIVCTAVSKTFNLAGLMTSNILIFNPELKARYAAEISARGFSCINFFGYNATIAVYKYGREWLRQVKEYVWNNVLFVDEFARDNMPRLKVYKPEGTYLMWLDFSAYGLKDEEIERLVSKVAKVWFDGGTIFGEEGKCCQRINLAMPKSVIAECMDRLYKAFEN